MNSSPRNKKPGFQRSFRENRVLWGRIDDAKTHQQEQVATCHRNQTLVNRRLRNSATQGWLISLSGFLLERQTPAVLAQVWCNHR
jgi:hypothetical protein